MSNKNLAKLIYDDYEDTPYLLTNALNLLSVLLHVCKTKSLRGRFSGGHKAFLWAWLDKYYDEDVRIAVQVISHWENSTLTIGVRSHYSESH